MVQFAPFTQSVPIDENNLEKLTTFYESAYNSILGEMKGATSFGVANRKALLAQIGVILKDLKGEIDPILAEELTKYYKDGANEAVDQLHVVKAPIDVEVGFNQIHRDAITVLIDDTSRAIAESIQGINRSSSRLLSSATKEQLTQQMALGKVGGKALKEIKNNVIGVLQDQGLISLVDKGNHPWTLDRYAQMLVRTKAVEARNRGMMNRIAENNYDLVQVSAHGADDICADWEGVILSVTGDTPGYPTVQDAESGGLFHPNCKHAINVLVPELAKFTEAYNPNVDTLTGNDFVDDVDVVLKGYTPNPNQIVAAKT
jgi:hypothetical protein